MKRVIVIFPQFEQGKIIGQFRRSFDPLSSKVAAHITLISQFESDLSSAELQRHIQEAVRDTQPFHVTLSGITGHEGEYLFLDVKRDNDELIHLRDALYRGPLDSHRLHHYTYIPHLTVGRLGDEALFFTALKIAKEVRITFEARVTTLSVYSIRPDGSRPIECNVTL